MKNLRFLLLAVTLPVTGCAFYSVEYTVETLDAAGNVVTRHIATGTAIVANSSDEVSFRMNSEAETKQIEFGKTNTGAEGQVQALDVISQNLLCAANPATCL